MSNRIVEWTLNGCSVRSREGLSLLEACHQAGCEIQSLCGGGEDGKSPACMLCLVCVEGESAPVASCGQLVKEGMVVDTENRAVTAAVKDSAGLLLSEHGGDCYSPCSLSCAGRLDTARMSRLIREGRYDKAANYAFRKLVFPELLSKLCRAPCMNNCRREMIDRAVDIPFLHGREIMKHFSLSGTGRKKNRALVFGNSPETWATAHFLNWGGTEVTLVHGRDDDFLRNTGFQTEEWVDCFSHDRERLKQSGVSLLPYSDFSFTGDEEFRWVFCGSSRGISIMPPGDWRTVIIEENEEASLLQRIMGGLKSVARQLGGAAGGYGKTRKSVSRIHAFSDEEKEIFRESFPPPADRKQIDRQAESCLLCSCSAAENCRLKDAALKTGVRQNKDVFLGKLEPVRLWGELAYEYSKCVGCMKCVNRGRIKINGVKQSMPGLGIAFKGMDTRIINSEGHAFSKGKASELIRICPTGALRLRYDFES